MRSTKRVIGAIGVWGAIALSEPGCGEKKTEENHPAPSRTTTPSATTYEPLKAGTMQIAGVAVEVMLPEGEASGNILLLPGWGFSRLDWCQKTDFCVRATAAGYRIFAPEMGKSIYASQPYPETRRDWRGYPTRKWVTDTLIPKLQKHGAFLPGAKNAAVGLSTGARGAVLIAQDLPEIFSHVAALSGDYNPAAVPQDNLMLGFYGPADQFPERRHGRDNPSERPLKAKCFLGHGEADRVVPASETRNFYEKIKSPDVRLHIIPGAGHTYEYWGGQTGAILAFLNGT
ncbi:MAG: alpha/beta hydrolase-fold protein [Bacteroidia bacterium]|nr:alpha/beta hydrolase-fold protein [Bacteroidia bacterium]MDW8334455.1 alpha/beta hydrolase-fold protein [Bacteroidia bacterium]